jgi:hypothetical protein
VGKKIHQLAILGKFFLIFPHNFITQSLFSVLITNYFITRVSKYIIFRSGRKQTRACRDITEKYTLLDRENTGCPILLRFSDHIKTHLVHTWLRWSSFYAYRVHENTGYPFYFGSHSIFNAHWSQTRFRWSIQQGFRQNLQLVWTFRSASRGQILQRFRFVWESTKEVSCWKDQLLVEFWRLIRGKVASSTLLKRNAPLRVNILAASNERMKLRYILWAQYVIYRNKYQPVATLFIIIFYYYFSSKD